MSISTSCIPCRPTDAFPPARTSRCSSGAMATCFIMSASRRRAGRARSGASMDWTALRVTRNRSRASQDWTAVRAAEALAYLTQALEAAASCLIRTARRARRRIRPHPTTPGDPTGGVDVTLRDGSNEHWWNDRIDGFIRSRISPFDSRAPAVPFVPPAGAAPNSVQPVVSPRPDDTTQSDPRNVRVLARIAAPGATPSLPDNASPSQQAVRPPGFITGQPMPDYPVPPWLFGFAGSIRGERR